MIEQDKIELITMKIAKRFKTFGRGSYHTDWEENPITYATRNKPLSFALGVDVDEVIRFIIQWDAYLDGRFKGNLK